MSLSSEMEEKVRGTLVLSYGYVTLYAQPVLITSRLEAVIARIIVPQFSHAKVTSPSYTSLLTVEAVLKDRRMGHKNVLSQDCWSLVTGSVILK